MEPGEGGRRDPLAWCAVAAGALWSFRDAWRWSDGTAAVSSKPITALWALLTPPLMALALEGIRRWEAGRLGRLGRGAIIAAWLGLVFLELVALIVGVDGRQENQLLLLFVGIDLVTLGVLLLGVLLLLRHTRDRLPLALLVAGSVGFIFTVDGSAFPILPEWLAYPLVAASLAFGPAWLWLGVTRIRRPQRLPGSHRSLGVRPTVAVVAVISLVLLAMAGVEGVSTKSARSLLHPARDHPTRTPASVNLSFDEIHLTTSDGIALFGWWIPATVNITGCSIVFLHGYADNRSQGLDVAPWLHEAGYNVLLFDFRGHGASGGDFTTVGLDEVHDVAAAAEFADRQPGVKPRCVGLFGYSMGAAAGLNALKSVPEVQAIVADSAFSDLENIVANSFRHFTCEAFVCLPKYPFGPLSVVAGAWISDRDLVNNVPARAVRGVEKPAFIIQGHNDTIVQPHTDGERLRDAFGVYGEYWDVKDAKHVNARRVAKGEYERRILDFYYRMLVPG